MKRLLLAGLLVLPLALSRTGARADQDDAYGSLVSMADSAASDRGPEAGAVPPDSRAVGEASSSAAGPSPESAPARAETHAKPAPAPAARREAPSKEDDAPSVPVPAAAAPRVWTRVFSALMPPMTRVTAFEVAASTAPRGARPEAAHPSTPASAAGSAQGLIELVAVATAPSLEP
jgi:hypothetical protein